MSTSDWTNIWDLKDVTVSHNVRDNTKPRPQRAVAIARCGQVGGNKDTKSFQDLRYIMIFTKKRITNIWYRGTAVKHDTQVANYDENESIRQSEILNHCGNI